MIELIAHLGKMKHSPVYNYAIPGLTSWVIGNPSFLGMVRMFECERQHQEPITPHSHRFDFTCQVLKGKVRNLIWTPDERGDLYQVSQLTYDGDTGKYKETVPLVNTKYSFYDEVHRAGDTYSMKADQVHSIFFDRGTIVLFFEGPPVASNSIILQPVVNGEVIPTFKVEDWMFRKEIKV